MKDNMAKLVRVTGAAVVMTVVMAPGWVHGQAGRFFGNIELGPSLVPDVDFRQVLPRLDPSLPDDPRALQLDPGIHLGASGGYYFTDWLALELETGFYAYSIDGFDGSPLVDVRDSTFSNVPFMANAIFEVPTGTRVAPFAGAGLGGSLSTLYADRMRDDLGVFLDDDDSDFVFAYQLFGGVRYALNDFMFLSLTYRYFVTEGPEWHLFAASGADVIELDRVQSHSINFGFSVRF